MQTINISFFSRYIKIYFWQFLAFIVRFFSMFIVLPFLTKDQTTYGVYAVCISVNIFFGYADFGFMRSGQKFASENIGNNNRDEEMKYIGFSTFILLIFTIIIAFLILLMSFNPHILLKGVKGQHELQIASRLLLILALFTPVTVFQRMISMIFEIRIENYINQKIFLMANILTVISVLYFFGNGKYDIVNYYLFSQIFNLISVLICLKIAKYKYNYNFGRLLSMIKFNKDVYIKCSKLAYSGLYIMLASIAFFELDNIIISKYIGINKVAIYSIALSISSIFRTFFGILFSPFAVRINYFVANEDYNNLTDFCKNILIQTAPLIILSTLSFLIISHSFIYSWVGPKYNDSVILAQLLTLTFSFSFVSYTASMLLVAIERVNEMYFIATMQPILYWVLVYLFYPIIGLASFGYFKLLCVFLVELYYLYILFNKIELNFNFLYLKILKPIILPILILISFLYILEYKFPYEKSKFNLFLISSIALISLVSSIITLYFTSIDFKVSLNKLIKLR